MQHRQNKDGAALTTLIAAAAYNADTVPAVWDIRNAQCVEIDLEVGAGGITFTGTDRIDFELTAADYDAVTGVVGSFSDVADGEVYLNGEVVDVTTGGIVKSLIVAHATGTPYRLEYVGPKGALKFRANFGGTHGAATPIAATGRLSHGRNTPAI